MTQLATVALLVLTIVAGLVAFGQWRPGGPELPLSHLSAPSDQPPAAATPAASPQAATALAEFVAEIRLGSGSLSTPTGLAVGADGTLYAIDAIQDHIRLFDPDGQPIGTWGQPGEQLRQFRFHEGSAFGGDLAFGPDGNLYVLDTFNSRIQVLNSDGAVVRAWGEVGSGEGQFTMPGGIAVDSAGHVYVADTENRRVQVFDAEGQFLKVLATPEDGGQRISPNDVAVDAAGIVSVSDGTRRQVVRFDTDGAIIGALGDDGSGADRMLDPEGLSSDAQGNLFVTDFVVNQVQVFTSDGTLLGTIGGVGVQPGQFISPVNLAIGPNDRLYVAEQGNSRIQVFQLLPPLSP
jgi:DNA-binding beta-propeller fold protein YncE